MKILFLLMRREFRQNEILVLLLLFAFILIFSLSNSYFFNVCDSTSNLMLPFSDQILALI